MANKITWTIGNKEVKSLTLNNKEVKSILRTIDNTIIYEKGGGGSGKIDTQIVPIFIGVRPRYFLQDINGNGLNDKTVYDIYSGGVNTYITRNSMYDGYILAYIMGELVFEGDDQYNGCRYTP